MQFNRLRHDVISNKVQISAPTWRDITTSDINDIVCDCSQESGLQITAREVLAVLQSHRIPDIHPLRDYVLNCRPWDTEQPNWIGWLAQQVTVEGDAGLNRLCPSLTTKYERNICICQKKAVILQRKIEKNRRYEKDIDHSERMLAEYVGMGSDSQSGADQRDTVGRQYPHPPDRGR